MVRRIVFALAALAVAGLFLWALRPQPVEVETQAAGPRTIDVTVEEEGEARIREVFTVSAPIAGRMLRLDLHEGDAVVAGQTVVASILPVAPALLDARARRIAEAAEGAAEAAVALAEAQLRDREAQFEFLSSEADRAAQLLRRGAIAERSYQKAMLDLSEAQASVASAQANLLVRQRELESARAALAEGGGDGGANGCCLRIAAPVSGRVLHVLTENEQVVQAGTPVVQIGDPGDIEIVVELLSRDAVRVLPGAGAVIDGWGGPPLEAAVRRIDPSAVTRVSALGIEEQRVTVVLDLKGDPEGWRQLGHGFRVVVRITVWHGEGVLAVPVGALFRQGADWAVYVVRDGRARLARVRIGERGAAYARVIEGLAEGDRVVLHPSDLVKDGVRVDETAVAEE